MDSSQSNNSTGIDLRASPDDQLPIERNKTVESVKESGLMGLKKKPTFNNKYLVVWINSKEGDTPVELKLELPNQCTVQDCVALALKTLNHLLLKDEKEFTLSDDANLYFLYISKKNGMPKTDYPPFDMDQKLNETSILTYTLVNKNDNVYKYKIQKPENNQKNTILMGPSSLPPSNKESILKTSQAHNSSIVKSSKDRQVVFSNKNTEVNVVQKRETLSKCDCLCFQWLFRKKSKDILLEGSNQNESDNVIRTSGI